VTSCALHREYLAAIADGEAAMVPAATVEHVKGCAECRREIQAHQLLTSKLRQATMLPEESAPERRRISSVPKRLVGIAAAVAAVVVVAGAGFGLYSLSRPDPVQAALSASSEPIQFNSTDPSQVSQWCLNASGRELPAIQLDGMQVVGARMDRVASTDIVTVVYTAPSGARVTVSWLEGQAPTGSGIEDRYLSGHQLLVVHSVVGTAVVTGSSTDAMWQTAAAIESTPA
jgi:hypothetical protein